MTDPRLPSEPTDDPTDGPNAGASGVPGDDTTDDAADAALEARQELVLDLVDGAAELDASVNDDDGSLHHAVDDQERARAAVAAPVDVSTFGRERAVKAALAEHAGREVPGVDKPPAAALAAARADVARRRSRKGPLTWVLPALGAAAAIVLLAGFIGVLFRGASTSMNASTSADMSAGAPVAGTAIQTQGAEQGGSTDKAAGTGPIDFGVVDDRSALVARVAGITNTLEAYSTNQAAPTAGAGTASDSNRSDLPASVTCEPSARAATPDLAAAAILLAGTVRYQDVPAVVYVFASPPPDGRRMVTVDATSCQVLVDTAL